MKNVYLILLVVSILSCTDGIFEEPIIGVIPTTRTLDLDEINDINLSMSEEEVLLENNFL